MKSDNLNDFQSYLACLQVGRSPNRLLSRKNAPYYIRWVSSCLPAATHTLAAQAGYAFANQLLSDVLTQAQKQDFLKHFACLRAITHRQAKTHEDWQYKFITLLENKKVSQ